MSEIQTTTVMPEAEVLEAAIPADTIQNKEGTGKDAFVTREYRHELKFILDPLKLDWLRQQIKLHPAAFETAYPPRWVNNVYFDTYDLKAYQENLSGASSRLKVRYRWYGQEALPQPGTLEVKCKRNQFGWKENYKVHDSVLNYGNNWHGVKRSIKEQLPGKAAVIFDRFPQAVLINRYYREYYLSKDGKVRITVDQKQQVYDQRLTGRVNDRHKINLPETIILEVKFDTASRDLGSDVLKGFPVRVSRHSKYAVGVQTMTSI